MLLIGRMALRDHLLAVVPIRWMDHSSDIDIDNEHMGGCWPRGSIDIPNLANRSSRTLQHLREFGVYATEAVHLSKLAQGKQSNIIWWKNSYK